MEVAFGIVAIVVGCVLIWLSQQDAGDGDRAEYLARTTSGRDA